MIEIEWVIWYSFGSNVHQENDAGDIGVLSTIIVSSGEQGPHRAGDDVPPARCEPNRSL